MALILTSMNKMHSMVSEKTSPWIKFLNSKHQNYPKHPEVCSACLPMAWVMTDIVVPLPSIIFLFYCHNLGFLKNLLENYLYLGDGEKCTWKYS